MSDTLELYTAFKDLQRYKKLSEKEKAEKRLTKEEQARLRTIEANETLKPYLPARTNKSE